MSLSYVGKLALSAILPSSAAAVAAADTGIAGAIPVVSNDFVGASTLAGRVSVTPPNLAAQIVTTAAIVVGLTAGVTIGAPFVDAQAPQLSDAIGALSPVVAGLSAAVGLTLPLAALFQEPNVQAWSFAGTSTELGTLLTAALGRGMPDGAPPHAPVTGYILASTAGATWSGMQSFFPALPGSQAPGTLLDVGPLSVGGLVGLLAGGIANANVSLSSQLGSLGARLRGLVGAAASLPTPTLAGNVAVAGRLASNLAAYAPAAYITPSAAVAATSALVAALSALSTRLSTNISQLFAITSALATAGVLGFRYSGAAEDLGAAVSSAISAGWPDGTSSTAPSNALVILVSGGGTASALAGLFGGL